MRVYRNNLETFNSSQYFPVYEIDGICYAQDRITRSHLQPKNGVIVKTGSSFKEVSVSINIQADKYYRLDGLREGTDELLWTEIDAETASEFATLAVFDIMEATYTGDDMGERKVVANIKYPTPIGFRIGDYIEIAMQSLTKNDTTIKTERFYIYSEPQCKKIARPMAAGDSFETIVTFYPPQYELGCIVLRDSIQEMSNVSNIIYTGFDTVTFEGSAFALLTRCVACMNAQFVDNDGNGLWSFDLAESLHEDNNRALERYLFSFSKTSVADALLKLNDPEQINTTFFINGRTIYAGYKRSYVCKVGSDMGITDVPMKFAYGKTSHLPVEHERGLLKNIFKSIGEEVPITKLFAYGATRNINRYYCADLIASGRYVNKLMLPSFSQDGHTDFVISEDGVKKFGIRERSKEFDNIYPTIQHMTYADIRGVKYCIKIKASGDEDDTKLESGLYDKQNSISKYAVARIQCYRVTPCTGNKDGEIGANKLVPCAPPEDLVVTVRATGKVVKCILRGGSTEKEAIDKQIASDGKWGNGNGRVPATSYHGSTYIPGACFCVHDNKFPDGEGKTYKDSERDKWFNAETTATTDSASELHRMEYVDTVLITDVYAFESYQQTHFRRDGYSAGCWARINNDSGQNDTLLVNEVVAVEPVIITDTDTNTATNSNQKTWDLYLRDLGFSPDEQNDFGDRVFVFDTIKVSFLDGLLTGREFTIAGNITDNQDVCVCAYNNDGTRNKYFFEDSGYTDGSVPETAFAKGAIWRFRLNRLNDEELENLGIIIPTKTLCAKEGDHVTLLDIYMPDVYVRAAENRLLKEAMKYLRHNDKGDVKYTAEFDQVRINQIPNYALQMREGVRVRLVDDDLNITTENTTRKIVDYPNGLDSQVSMFTIEQNVTEKTIESTFYYTPGYEDITQFNPALSTRHPNVFKKYIENYDKESQIIKIKVPRNNSLSVSVNNLELFISPRNKYSKTRDGYMAKTANISAIKNGTSTWSISFDCTQEEYDILRNDAHQIIVDLYESVIDTESHKYNNSGTPYYAIANEIVEFLSGKFYDVVLDVESAFAGNQIEFLLCKSKDVESTKYIPAYTITELAETGVKEGFTRIKVSFFLDDSFDDSVGYYPAVKYIADGNTEYTSIRLLSVTEKDVDEDGNLLNYADVTVDHVTVKITDNTRGANTRILDSYPEPIREIQATFNSNKKASSWAKVMSRVGATEKEVEARKTTFQSIINDARRNYRALLSLRNSIFDPDSNTNDKCDYNFLRVMMMQVGADSMNYLLDKTYQSADGQPHNYSISRSSNSSNPVFNVNSEDKLSHLVYVQSGENGHWTIPAPFIQELQQDNDGTWSPYFVCIRCRKNGANALNENAWICSKHQYAVNQDTNPETGATTDQYGNPMTDYWYFNWAILTCPNNDGDYVLRETRGNAYMYGDNLICGKISDLSQKSYFDLTNGDFVLGQTSDGNAALSYINGVLTIGGFDPDEPDGSLDDILIRLGVVEGVASGAESTANAASAAAKNAQTTADGAATAAATAQTTADGAAADAEAAVTAAQVAEGKVSALEYLTTALGNYTAIAGGLIVTSQMQLGDKTGKYVDKDGKEYTENGEGLTEQYKVNAGISGVNADNILLWGGGTYAEAVIAEQNNYVKDTEGNCITSLLKRDGTGKIGICRITDSELKVNIKDKGSVIIDASEDNGGIRFFNSDGMLVSGIILGSIAGYSNAPLEGGTTTNEDTINYNKISEQYIGVGENTYTLEPQSDDVPQEGVVEVHENNYIKTTTTSITNKSITVAPILIDGRIEVQVEYGSNTPTGEFTIDLYNDNGELLKTDVSRFDFENQGGSNYIYKADFEKQTLFVNSVIDGYDGNVNVIVTLNLQGNIINITSCDLSLSQGKDNYCKYKITTTTSYSYHSYTLVGSDGFVSVKDNKRYFVIDNSESEQKILTSGLPVLPTGVNPESQGVKKGQLYVVNGTLKVY